MLSSLIAGLAIQIALPPGQEQLDPAALAMVLEWDYPQLAVIPFEELERLCSKVLDQREAVSAEVRAQVLARRADLRLAFQKSASAAADYDEVLELDAENVRARGGRTFVRLRTSDGHAVVEHEARALIREHPNSAEGYFVLAAYYVAHARFHQAIEYLTQGIERDPRNPRAYFNRALAYHKAGDHRSALADLERVSALPPTSLASASDPIDEVRGLVLCHLGRYNDAFAFLAKEYREQPEFAVAGGLWHAATHLRRFGTAAHVAQEMVRSWPDKPQAKCLYALSLAQFERYDEALRVLREGESQASNPALGAHVRPRILAAMGRHAEAAEAYEASLAGTPKSPDSSLRYALLLATCPDDRIRNAERSVDHARVACSALDDTLYEPEARIVLAMSLAATGSRRAALEELDAVTKLDTVAEAIREQCARLRGLFAEGRDIHDAKSPERVLFEIPVGLTVGAWPPAHAADSVPVAVQLVLPPGEERPEAKVDTASVAAVLEWEYPQPSVIPLEKLEGLCSHLLERGDALDSGIRGAVLLRRADARLALKKDELAAADYEAILDGNPENIKARARRAFLRLRTNNRPELMHDEGTALIHEHPDAPEGYQLLGVYYGGAQRFNEAIDYLTRGIEREPGRSSAYVSRAMAFYKLGDHASALQDVERVAALPPSYNSNSEAKLDAFRGLTLTHIGRYHEAFPFLAKAHREEPDDKGIAVTLWKLATHLRKFGTSSHLTQRMVETWPDESRAKCLHALSKAQFSRCDEALQLLDDAEAQAGSEIGVHERPRILGALGRHAEAAAAYEASLSVHAKWPDSSLRYALLLASCPDADVRDPDRAVSHARDALGALQGKLYEPEARIVLAMALAASGDHKSAIEELDTALKLDWLPDATREQCRRLRKLFADGKPYIDEGPQAQRFKIPVGLTVDTWPPPNQPEVTPSAKPGGG